MLKNPAIAKQLARYYINRKFYDNKIPDADIEAEKYFDHDMR